MTNTTPLRIARAMGHPAGRERYRAALRDRIWRALHALPFPVAFNARLGDSLRIRISSQDRVISRAIFVTGEWEPVELAFIRKYVKPGMTAFDVGANIGAHALTMAAKVGPQGKVHVFEPTRVFRTLSHNVKLNGFRDRVTLNNCAVSDSNGTLRLLSCKPGFELFTSRETPLLPEASSGRYIEFPCTTLDAYALQHGIENIDFLKVDVEGSEDLVFQGCAGLLARQAIGCIMFELNEVCMTDVGDSASAMVARIRDAGYTLMMIDAAGRFSPLPRVLHGVFNVVATRDTPAGS